MKILITAGQVYGRLDDNKLVGNRVRGLWACRFAGYLSTLGHEVTLLVPDTMPRFDDFNALCGSMENRGPICREGHGGLPGAIEIVRQSGFWDYQNKCLNMAETHDAAVMAAAVVNWIPANPIKGKMPTDGYEVGDIIQIPFILAPRVIWGMKNVNPKITLIGCKMLIGSTEDELIDAAYGVLLKNRCNVVVANDMGNGLKQKKLVYPDRSVHVFDDDFDGFYAALRAAIEDDHWSTSLTGILDESGQSCPKARALFDTIVEKYRDRFTPVEGGRVYGSVAVRCDINGWITSPREKGEAFTSADASVVVALDWDKHIVIAHTRKATLNAPLLIRYAALFNHDAVVHFHEQIEGLPTLPYAPPGTERDNNRVLAAMVPAYGFNIEGHGCVLPLDAEGNLFRGLRFPARPVVGVGRMRR